MRFHFLFVRVVSGLAASLGILLFSTSATAAEQVVLKYRILRQSVSVSELTTFAQTGELSPTLQSYLKMARRNPEQVRQILTRQVKVDPILLERALNSQIGEAILDQVGQVIHTPDEQANREALRSALVISAQGDGKITLIEALKNYPTSSVHLDGDRLAQVIAEAYGQLTKLAGRLPKRV